MIVDIWICNGFVVIFDGTSRLRKEVKPEE